MTENRDRIETDEIVHALQLCSQLLSSKEIPSENIPSWLKSLRPYGKEDVIDAIQAHISGSSGNCSKYAPRPMHIINLLNAQKDRKRGFSKDTGEVVKECDPRVAKAWIMFMSETLGFSITKDNNPEIKMTRDQMFIIVNQQAAKHGNPDAIPAEYRIAEYWT